MVRLADVRPCPNCASKVVPASICNTCGSVAIRADLGDVDRKIACTECKTENPTLFVCEKCNNRFLFEEVAGPAKEQFACLLCGTFVDSDAKACPACGAVFEEEPPRAPGPKRERLKRKVRGEFSDSDVAEIARIPGVGRVKAEALCRAGYNALWKIKRAPDEELARIRQIGARGAKTVKDSLRFILLLPRRKSKEEVLSEEHVCPLCGCVTSLFAKSCADCGAVFDEEEIDDDLRREVEKEHDKGVLAFYDVHREETPEDPDLWYARALLLLDMNELPEAMRSIDTATRLDPASRRVQMVRARILASMREMKQSAAALRGTLSGLVREVDANVVEVKAAEEDVKAASDALDALSALAERECPTCGERVLPDAVLCPACGSRLEPVPAGPAVAEDLLAPVAPLKPEGVPAAAPGLAALNELEEIIEQAPRKGRPPKAEARAEAPEERPGSPPPRELERAPPPPPEAVPRPKPQGQAPSRRPMETPPPRERVLQAPQARFRRGLINGHGLVNGSGRVNGLVNGFGFMDTSAVTEFRGPTRSLISRYVAITASLLLAFVIVAALIPAPPAPTPTIVIDGNPNDWSSFPLYTDASPATDANVSIQQYGVYRESDSLSFLVRVSGQALGDAVGNDAFYVFFDTDASNATGYQVRGLGADYVAEVLGGSGRVASARLFEFPPDSEMNWSRRVAVTGISAAAAGGYLELRVPTDNFVAFSPTASTFLIAADDFDGSESHAGAVLTATFGAIRIRQVPLVGVLPSGSTPALRLDIAAVGALGATDAWSVGPFSFTATSGVTVTPSPAQVTLTQASPTASVTVSVSATGLPAGTPVFVSLRTAPATHPVTVTGARLGAYFGSVPPGIRIDGLFADWSSLAVRDSDPAPIARESLDIRSYGGASNASGTFFMLQVAGPLYEGSFAPHKVPRYPPGGGGGGGQGAPPPRVTGEDIARVFIDSNSTDTAGVLVGGIYADYMVEVRGIDGRITRRSAFRWQAGWVPTTLSLAVAKNETAMEGSLGLNPALVNATRMVFETSDWSGRGDVTNVLLTRSTNPPETRTDPGPVPLPEFHEIVLPAIACVLLVVLLRRGRRRPSTRPSR